MTVKVPAIILSVMAVTACSRTADARGLYAGLGLPHDQAIQSLVDSVNADSLMATVRRLQAFATRRTHTDSCRAAADWIQGRLGGWGYQVSVDSFWVDSLYHGFGTTINIHTAGYAYNLEALVPGRADSQASYVLGGHYDSFNEHSQPNSYDDPYAPAPGADDNGTGVACMLECARLFRQRPWESSLRFVALGNEEFPYSGGYRYASRARQSGLDIGAFINLDCIGFDGAEPGAMTDWYGDSSGQALSELYRQVGRLYAPGIGLQVGEYRPIGDTLYTPDFWPFCYFGYPSIMAMEKDWKHNFTRFMHSVGDTAGNIDPAFFAAAVKNAAAAMAVLSDYPSPVDLRIDEMSAGTTVRVAWLPNPKHDVAFYRTFFGHRSGRIDSTMTTQLCDTIEGLSPGSTYHITVRAYDAQGHPSVLAYDHIYTPR